MCRARSVQRTRNCRASWRVAGRASSIPVRRWGGGPGAVIKQRKDGCSKENERILGQFLKFKPLEGHSNSIATNSRIESNAPVHYRYYSFSHLLYVTPISYFLS